MADHIESQRTYLLVFAGLLALTLTTVVVSFVELGSFHVLTALLTASIKAALVLLFFMHVLHSNRLIWMAIVAAGLFVAILFLHTFSDYISRGWLSDSPSINQVRP